MAKEKNRKVIITILGIGLVVSVLFNWILLFANASLSQAWSEEGIAEGRRQITHELINQEISCLDYITLGVGNETRNFMDADCWKQVFGMEIIPNSTQQEGISEPDEEDCGEEACSA